MSPRHSIFISKATAIILLVQMLYLGWVCGMSSKKCTRKRFTFLNGLAKFSRTRYLPPEAIFPIISQEELSHVPLLCQSQVKWRLMVTSCYRRMQNLHKALELYEKIHTEHPENLECKYKKKIFMFFPLNVILYFYFLQVFGILWQYAKILVGHMMCTNRS